MKSPLAAIGPVLLLLAIVILAGCDRHSRHRALNFFFTGVPPLEDRTANGPEPTEQEQTRGKPQNAAVRMRSAHSYFTGNQCSRCHQVSMAFGGGRGVWKPAAPAAVAKSLPSRTPGLGICVNCHEDPFEAAGTNAPRPHAPVECGVCHLPHQSEHPALLRSAVSEICAICHMDAARSGAGFHRAPLRRDFAD